MDDPDHCINNFTFLYGFCKLRTFGFEDDANQQSKHKPVPFLGFFAVNSFCCVSTHTLREWLFQCKWNSGASEKIQSFVINNWGIGATILSCSTCWLVIYQQVQHHCQTKSCKVYLHLRNCTFKFFSCPVEALRLYTYLLPLQGVERGLRVRAHLILACTSAEHNPSRHTRTIITFP